LFPSILLHGIKSLRLKIRLCLIEKTKLELIFEEEINFAFLLENSVDFAGSAEDIITVRL
jgi:hypothetical protein